MAGKWSGRKVGRLMRLVLAEYGTTCHICGLPLLLDAEHPDYRRLGPSVDHLLPRSRHGSDELVNLRPAHRACNSRRGARPVTRVAVEDGRAFFKP
jgi:5-methylcytosine-specific restriction endonuclease McrA